MGKRGTWYLVLVLVLASYVLGCTDDDADLVASDAAIGERTDAQPDAQIDGQTDDESDAGELSCRCEDSAEGVYALKLVLDAYWRDEVNAAHLVEPGRGAIELYYRAEISGTCADGGRGSAKLSPCGIEVPPVLIGVICTAMQMQFPAELWDAPGLPEYEAEVRSTGFDAGLLLSITKASVLLGLDEADLERGFPSYAPELSLPQDVCGDGELGVDCYPDHDGDGHPGVTVTFADMGTITTSSSPHRASYECNGLYPDWSVRRPRLLLVGDFGPPPASLVTEAYVGLHLPASGLGLIGEPCLGEASGLGPSTALAVRGAGCRSVDGEECDYSARRFIDSLLPRYHVLAAGEVPPAEWKHPIREEQIGRTLDRTKSRGPRMTMTRLGALGASASCADVREARFDALE